MTSFCAQTICLNERLNEVNGPEGLGANSPLNIPYGENNCIYVDSLSAYDNTSASGFGGTSNQACPIGVCCGTGYVGQTADDAFYNREPYYKFELTCLNNPADTTSINIAGDSVFVFADVDTGCALLLRYCLSVILMR